MILTSTQVKKKKTTLFGWLADLYAASGREKKAPLFGEPFYNSAPC